MKLSGVAIAVVFVVGGFGACTRVENRKPPPTVALGDGGGAGVPAGGSGSLAGFGGDGNGGEHLGMGGAPGGIELGVWPTFVADPAAPRDVQAVFASVSALSMGATTLPLAERWDALSGATGSPRTVTWNRLDAMTKPFRDRDGNVALCIDIVEREAFAWPFTQALDLDIVKAAMDRTIDEVYARYGAQLSHLCFGYELDRYLARATETDGAIVLALLQHSVDYASSHALRNPQKTSVGAAISLKALAGESKAPLEQLLLGDEVIAVYDPLDDEGALKPPASIGAEVTAALETIAAAGGPTLPLSLFEVGYPSGANVGSSEKDQRSFYDALFTTLDEHRDEVAFVGIFGLGDRAAADCEAEAATFGGSASQQDSRALARCSMGLRAEPEPPAQTETEKLAWPSVLAALAAYR